MKRLSPADPNSYSRPDQVVVSSLHLNWDVDFSRKIVSGTATLTVERKQDDAVHLILDTRDLTIKSVKDEETGQVLQYAMGEAHPNFGSDLKIVLPSDAKKKFKIQIEYETSPSCSALQWLAPEQTAGKQHPYVFSQCQAIHCRSLVPCQDSPAVKIPYTAEVSAPSGLVVLMSALRDGQQEKENRAVYRFRQPVPMPSYLIAIAVGALESRKIGPRSLVWSEKEYVEKAEFEFSETETMLKTAESLCGDYVWGQYDLLILPPSFPYGGMENPCLTFVTPTLLAGDRSLADVVAHEISHSWTGNLITNCQWEHFWLNEGFTMFVERKIAGRMCGEATRNFAAIGGWKDLAECIRTRGENDPLTCLIPDLTGVDPDDAFSTVPYEKGHTLLWYLETLVGGPSEFEPFLKAYLDKFKYQSITSEVFRSFLFEYFVDKKNVFDAVDWQAWWHTPGMPPIEPQFDDSLAVVCKTLCKKWVEWDLAKDCPFLKDDLDKMSSNQRREWLALLLEEDALPIKKLEKMNELYNMSSRNNAEIKFRWLRLGLKAHWKEQADEALKFVTEQGRMKYVRPIYRDLYDWEEMRQQAIAVYKANKDSMMHVAAYVVTKDLHLNE
ncbi:leukotriene A-4 hydrolase-like isoform X1 [Homarus americanus]|uniref:leukotriene A-4 hydrolase-like isoform X1 n=1 Tax=Homarus americanus TaxID=6706 RepID=UPI001C44A95A|nr:leukotriene A-4 hydrolase-like isoform X1 [Homarus americanus]